MPVSEPYVIPRASPSAGLCVRLAQDEPFDVFERFWITPGYGPGLMPGSIEVVQTSEHRPHNLRITGSCRLQPVWQEAIGGGFNRSTQQIS